jgi:hypothetical protein
VVLDQGGGRESFGFLFVVAVYIFWLEVGKSDVSQPSYEVLPALAIAL